MCNHCWAAMRRTTDLVPPHWKKWVEDEEDRLSARHEELVAALGSKEFAGDRLAEWKVLAS